MTTIAIIPARSGSSGIPNKNLIGGPLLCGRPLISWTVDAAAESCDTVLVSTDDDATLHYADTHERGNVLGVRRPAHLCTATASSESAIMHALGEFSTRDDEEIVFLQLTSPLRTARHIREALAVYRDSGADTLVSVEPGAHCHFAGHAIGASGYDPIRDIAAPNPPRQHLTSMWRENGAIYIACAAWWRARGTRIGGWISRYEMHAHDSIDIDTPADMVAAEAIMRWRDS